MQTIFAELETREGGAQQSFYQALSMWFCCSLEVSSDS